MKKLIGAIVSFALLVGPAAAALTLSRRWRAIIPLTIIIGIAAACMGLVLSFVYDLPSGPAIAACAVAPIVLAGTWRCIR